MQNAKLCAREGVDVAVWGHLVILQVNHVVIHSMGRHKLGLLLGEHIKEVVVLGWDYFGDKFAFIHWKGFRVEGCCWGRIVPNST